MFESVQALIKRMSKNMMLKSARLLTGLIAMMVPQNRRVSIVTTVTSLVSRNIFATRWIIELHTMNILN